MSTSSRLPVVSPETGLSSYLAEIRKFPMLEKEQEYKLATQWIEEGDREAAHKLVTSHLRLSAKIAMGYRGYGLPVSELISEGNVGLMQAVKKYDPQKGFRLATYAMWWIRASIQEYILRSWSLVKLGTTAAQKKLFFNLRRVKSQIGALDDGDMQPEHVTQIANQLDVNEDEVVSMNRRMERGGDTSLNVQIGQGDDGGGAEWQDWLTDEDADQAVHYAERDEFSQRHDLLMQAMDVLNEREQHILSERRLKDTPATLEDLSSIYSISRERVRQIEVRAFEKLEQRMRELAIEKGLIPSVNTPS